MTVLSPLSARRAARLAAGAVALLTLAVTAPTAQSADAATPAADPGADPGGGPVAVVAPDPPGLASDGITLTDVDCAGPGDCTAVGDLSRATSQARRPVVEHYLTGDWTPVRLPLPPHVGRAQDVVMAQISCPTSDFCVAVGSAFLRPTSPTTKSKGSIVIETWDGRTWTATSPALPADAYRPTTSFASAVDCAGAGWCVAVGGYRTAPNDGLPLAVVYDGVTWTVQVLPRAGSGTLDRLEDISCSEPGACTAVGQTVSAPYDTRPLVDTLAGGTWHAAVAPLPSDAEADGFGDAFFNAVSCPTLGSCGAAGTYEAGHGPGARHLHLAGIVTLVDDGDLTTYPVSAPSDVGGTKADVQVESIDCWAAQRCLAGGSADSGRGGHRRRGTLTTVGPGGSLTDVALGTTQRPGRFESVDCAATGDCVAVASSLNGITASGAIAVVTGGAASVTPAPAPPGADGVPSPQVVALEDAHHAVAVGSLYVSQPAFREDGLLISGITLP